MVKKIAFFSSLIFLFLILVSLVIIKKGNITINQISKKNFTTSVISYIPENFITETPSPSSFPRERNKNAWIKVRDLEKLSLKTNFEERLTSSDASEKYNCISLISGGFFKENYQPIGLFIANGKKISDSIKNPIFNGFFYVSSNKASISFKEPDNAEFAVQSGPILMLNGKTQIINDDKGENSRRIVVGTTQDGNVVFLVFYNTANLLSGPKLSELPDLIDKLNSSAGLNLKDALNLDGGSHSAFLADIIKISEISSIGSFFCVNP